MVRPTQAEFESLVNRVEDLEDMVLLRDAEPRGGPSADALEVSDVKALLSGTHPARIWRQHRGLSLASLADQTGIPAGYVSEIEHGKKPGSLSAYLKIAAALSLTVDDLLPKAKA
jgi:DNA-binding XRE family transcriptional regulator